MWKALDLIVPLSDTSIEHTCDAPKGAESEENTKDTNEKPDSNTKSDTSEPSNTKHALDTYEDKTCDDLVSVSKQIKSDLKLALEKGDKVMTELSNENARILSAMETYDPSEMDDLFDDDSSDATSLDATSLDVTSLDTSSLDATSLDATSSAPHSISSYHSYQSQGSRESLMSPVSSVQIKTCFLFKETGLINGSWDWPK